MPTGQDGWARVHPRGVLRQAPSRRHWLSPREARFNRRYKALKQIIDGWVDQVDVGAGRCPTEAQADRLVEDVREWALAQTRQDERDDFWLMNVWSDFELSKAYNELMDQVVGLVTLTPCTAAGRVAILLKAIGLQGLVSDDWTNVRQSRSSLFPPPPPPPPPSPPGGTEPRCPGAPRVERVGLPVKQLFRDFALGAPPERPNPPPLPEGMQRHPFPSPTGDKDEDDATPVRVHVRAPARPAAPAPAPTAPASPASPASPVYDIAKELAGAEGRKQAGIKALAYAEARRAEIVLEEERRFAAETAAKKISVAAAAVAKEERERQTREAAMRTQEADAVVLRAKQRALDVKFAQKAVEEERARKRRRNEEEARLAVEHAKLEKQRLVIESSLGLMPALPTYTSLEPAAVPVVTTSQESDSEIIAILGRQDEEDDDGDGGCDDGDDGCGGTPAQDDSEAQKLITLARKCAGDTQTV